ncbi:MAG: ACR3 family arsenite efflux transporter [Campylobacter sp.]|nr:ACR3 family arsenite efflux transporter [Campylobacter sp.]
MKILDKFLTLWIFLAIFAGLVLGNIFPNIISFWALFEYKNLNLLLCFCLILMMYPPLAKVDYSKIFEFFKFKNKKVLFLSLFLNWIFAPILMFILALIFLYDEREYFVGVVIIGLARCVAMVVVWSDLAKADRELTAFLVALNSIFQILCFSSLAYLFLTLIPKFLGFDFVELDISIVSLSQNVFIFLGIPFILGFLSRFLIQLKGKAWYEDDFLPKISPITLITLLFTIVMMCSYRANSIFSLPLVVLKISLPLIAYFVLMFFISWFLSKRNHFSYPQTCSVCFSASGNNFELAIAICIASFGIHSNEAFASIIGPLIEVPVLILLVKWALARFKV